MAQRFIADRMLGRLAKQLRMLGYDTVYYRGVDPRELIGLARREERLVLTRNTRVKAERETDRVMILIHDQASLQVGELLQQGLIAPDDSPPLSRCLVCNTPLTPIAKSEAEGKVPQFIFYQMKAFSRCGQCQRIYWQGTHHGNMEGRIKRMWDAAPRGPLPNT
jgi:uncharacterized protein